MKCYYCDRTVSFTAQKHNGNKVCSWCREAILIGRQEAAEELSHKIDSGQGKPVNDSAEAAQAVYESWDETAKNVVDILMQRVRETERNRAAEIINKRRKYDCTCSCECHGDDSPCNTCQADLEVIEMIRNDEGDSE